MLLRVLVDRWWWNKPNKNKEELAFNQKIGHIQFCVNKFNAISNYNQNSTSWIYREMLAHTSCKLMFDAITVRHEYSWYHPLRPLMNIHNAFQCLSVIIIMTWSFFTAQRNNNGCLWASLKNVYIKYNLNTFFHISFEILLLSEHRLYLFFVQLSKPTRMSAFVLVYVWAEATQYFICLINCLSLWRIIKIQEKTDSLMHFTS